MRNYFSELEKKAKTYATYCHDSTNHKLDEYPYTFHLALVRMYAYIFQNIESDIPFETLAAACWAHDTIEDARQTYNDVKDALGVTVADIVFAVTTEKGKSRKERANQKYYDGIKTTPGAIFVKLCDRLANVFYSSLNKSKMFDKYKMEHQDFIENLGLNQNAKYDIMVKELESMFNC